MIGRAGNIGDYIKKGNDKGMIEIELYVRDESQIYILNNSYFEYRFNAEKGPNWIVNRTLQAHQASKWSLNGKQTTETAVRRI